MRHCFIVAGPNGSGKTTFAARYLPEDVHCLHFINADLIAGGLSPFRPEDAALEAGRLMLDRIDAFASAGESFAFETTLSGRTYASRIGHWRRNGYRIVILYLWLESVDLAIERVKTRVREGGHNVPEEDIRRRYERGWSNFNGVYKPLADRWTVFDNSGERPIIIEEST